MTIEEKMTLLKDGVTVRITKLVSEEITKVKVGDIVTFKKWYMPENIEDWPFFNTYELDGFVFYPENVEIVTDKQSNYVKPIIQLRKITYNELELMMETLLLRVKQRPDLLNNDHKEGITEFIKQQNDKLKLFIN